MSFIEWDGSLELNHEIIDQDHRLMSDLMNRVVQAIEARCPEGGKELWRRAIVSEIGVLRLATDSHFRSEEWIMGMAGYPNLDAHRKQHRFLLAELDTFAGTAWQPEVESNVHAARFLHEWFECHVRVWDLALVRYLNGLDPNRRGPRASASVASV